MVDPLEAMNETTVEKTPDFECEPLGAAEFLDPSNETMTALEFLDNIYSAVLGSDSEQWESLRPGAWPEQHRRRLQLQVANGV